MSSPAARSRSSLGASGMVMPRSKMGSKLQSSSASCSPCLGSPPAATSPSGPPSSGSRTFPSASLPSTALSDDVAVMVPRVSLLGNRLRMGAVSSSVPSRSIATCSACVGSSVLARSARKASAACIVETVFSGQGAGKRRCTSRSVASSVFPRMPLPDSTMAWPRPTRTNSEPFSWTKPRKRLTCRTAGTAEFRASERMKSTISGRCARLLRTPDSLLKTCSRMSSTMGVLCIVTSNLATDPSSE
mmetsp:Transcript_18441/g.43324  ORF Transcript_18441/g.43324 Transcript_18441/m.43324 type:complete len:245 (-) Transcript_18441:427-1161(-)